MNIIKKIVLGIFGIIVLALLIALFLPKEYAIEREIIINQPKDIVFNYVKLLKNQDNFSVWFSKDPAIKKPFS